MFLRSFYKNIYEKEGIVLSWKSVEMQVALPRTQDAGKLQDQSMRQSQHFQESLAQSQLKEQALKRKRVNTFEDVQYASMEKEKEKEKASDHKENHDKQQHVAKNNTKQKWIEHPYLGKKVDLSR